MFHLLFKKMCSKRLKNRTERGVKFQHSSKTIFRSFGSRCLLQVLKNIKWKGYKPIHKPSQKSCIKSTNKPSKKTDRNIISLSFIILASSFFFILLSKGFCKEISFLSKYCIIFYLKCLPKLLSSLSLS